MSKTTNSHSNTVFALQARIASKNGQPYEGPKADWEDVSPDYSTAAQAQNAKEKVTGLLDGNILPDSLCGLRLLATSVPARALFDLFNAKEEFRIVERTVSATREIDEVDGVTTTFETIKTVEKTFVPAAAEGTRQAA